MTHTKQSGTIGDSTESCMYRTAPDKPTISPTLRAMLLESELYWLTKDHTGEVLAHKSEPYIVTMTITGEQIWLSTQSVPLEHFKGYDFSGIHWRESLIDIRDTSQWIEQ